jgi:putative Mn2+ efflux pump MntP
MLPALCWLALLLSLDTFVVGVGLGAALPHRYRLRIALTFAVCDGLASFLGWATRREWGAVLEMSEWFGPVAAATYGLGVLRLAWRGRGLVKTGAVGWLMLGLPLCLSLDNFAVGVGIDASGVGAATAALALGAVSGSLALLGLWLGAVLTTCLRLRGEWLGGTILLVAAIALLCKDAIP